MMMLRNYSVFVCLLVLSFSCHKKEIIHLPAATDTTWRIFDQTSFQGNDAIIRSLRINGKTKSLWIDSDDLLISYDTTGKYITGGQNIWEINSGFENALSDEFYAFPAAVSGNKLYALILYYIKDPDYYYLYTDSIDPSFYKVDIAQQNAVFSNNNFLVTNFASTKDNHPHLFFYKMDMHNFNYNWKLIVMTEENSSHLNVIRPVKDYFLISATNATYKADSTGAYKKVSDHVFKEFFTYHDTCFADKGDWIYYSADDGDSWQIYSQSEQAFPSRKFFIVNDKLYFFSSDKIYAVKSFPDLTYIEMDNTRLEGNLIVGMVQSGQRIYAGTNNGVYCKELIDFH